MYGISEKTFNTWLEPHKEKIGQRLGWYYNVKQVNIIFDLLGVPDELY